MIKCQLSREHFDFETKEEKLMRKTGKRIAAFCLAVIMAFVLSVVVIDPIDTGAAISPYIRQWIP